MKKKIKKIFIVYKKARRNKRKFRFRKKIKYHEG